jgi:hypothetical protein
MTIEGVASPFSSCEVRWFLGGRTADYAEILDWFTGFRPFAKEGHVGTPEWRGRLGDEPDKYLLLPGRDDMGIKWREGTLQIKGLVDEPGPKGFAGRHEGRVQRWIKWTYDELPPSYRSIIDPDVVDGLLTVAVQKTRAQRMFRLDRRREPVEMAPGIFLERGLGFELTDLEVLGAPSCSVAFEAFPDDDAMLPDFLDTVDRLLQGLQCADLDIGQSASYPSWLPVVVA